MYILVETLVKGAYELGIKLTGEQIGQFKKYYRLMIETNKYINLTAITGEKEVAIKHFIDSLTCFKTECFQSFDSLLDVGTGAGFPGLPIKICRPEINVTLIDAVRKRVEFLNEVIGELELAAIGATHSRAEDFARVKGQRDRYDRVVARAVAGAPILAEYCLPLLKVGGHFIAMKGPEIEEEIEATGKALEVLGGKVDQIINIKLPFIGDERNLIVIKKIKPTPEKYPRRSGVPQKKPLL